MCSSAENRPSFIQSTFQFGRVVEYMLFSFGREFSLRNGANKDPNIKLLAQVMPKLKLETSQELDAALEKNNYVALSVSFSLLIASINTLLLL